MSQLLVKLPGNIRKFPLETECPLRVDRLYFTPIAILFTNLNLCSIFNGQERPSVLTVVQIVAPDKLVRIIPTLCGDLSYPGWSSKIDL